MNIASKRFSIKTMSPTTVVIRDRNAPYHCHVIGAYKVPTLNELTYMTEAQFDKFMSELVYSPETYKGVIS